MSKIQFASAETLRIGRKTTERMLSAARFPTMTAAKIRLLGHSKVAGGGFDIRRPNPDFQQVLAVTSGRGRVWFRDKWRDLAEGDAFLSPALEPHCYHVSGSWELVWCIFEAGAFPDLQGAPVVRRINALLWTHIVLGLLETAAQAADDTHSLDHWISILKSESQRLVDGGHERVLAPLWNHVRRNLAHRWTLDLLAQRAGMNVETLRQHCLREHEMSPVSYLTHLRMNHASDMLRYGLKVEHVAQMVGYESPFTFSTAFRRVVGVPPVTLKAKMRKE